MFLQKFGKTEEILQTRVYKEMKKKPECHEKPVHTQTEESKSCKDNYF